MCNWRQDLRLSTKEIETLLGKERVLKQQAGKETARHSQPSTSVTRKLAAVRQEMSKRRRAAGLA